MYPIKTMEWLDQSSLHPLKSSVADSAFHFDADSYSTFHYDADPSGSYFKINPDSDPTTHFFPDLDPPMLQNDPLICFHLFTLMRIRIQHIDKKTPRNKMPIQSLYKTIVLYRVLSNYLFLLPVQIWFKENIKYRCSTTNLFWILPTFI